MQISKQGTMIRVFSFLVVGLFASCNFQQLVAQSGEVQAPDCSRFANGYKIAGQNPAHFYFCQNQVAIPMFCPPGLNFCYNGHYGVCSQFCTNVSPQPSDAPGGCGTSEGTIGTGTEDSNSSPASTELPTGPTSSGTGTTISISTELPTGPTSSGTGSTRPPSTELPTGPTTAAQSSVSTLTPTPPTTTSSTSTTTPAPPNPQTVCDENPFGQIFSVVGDCSAFGVCILGKPVFGRCLGNRLFDPVWGACTGFKCSN